MYVRRRSSQMRAFMPLPQMSTWSRALTPVPGVHDVGLNQLLADEERRRGGSTLAGHPRAHTPPHTHSVASPAARIQDSR